MRLLTGDECGLLKEFLPSAVKNNEPNGAVVANTGIHRINHHDKMARTNGVVGLTWTEGSGFACIRIDGSVELWEAQYESTTRRGAYHRASKLDRVFGGETSSSFLPNTPRRAIGLHSLSSSDNNNLLCACNAAGKVVLLQPKNREIVQEFDAYAKGDKGYPLVTAFAVHETTAGVGGRDRETVLYDVNTAQQVWKAKNLPPDPQTLLQPQVWPTAMTFLSDSILCVGTAHHQVRIYDVRLAAGAAGVLQRRPIKYTTPPSSSTTTTVSSSFLEHRVTSLCKIAEHDVAVGDAAGYIHAIDIRKLPGGVGSTASATALSNNQAAVLGCFVGPAGSVKQLVKHATLPRMAAVGLDRMLRIYDTGSRKQLQTVYLTQRLNCVLISDEDILQDDSNVNQEDDVRDYVDSDGEHEEDIDDVLEQIDEVRDVMSASSDDAESESSGEQEPPSPRKRRREGGM